MPLTFRQQTSGVGPIGSLGVIARFFRDSLEIYGDAQVGFIISTLETSTGTFLTLVNDPSQGIESRYPARGGLEHSVSKDVWQLTGTVGLRYFITDAWLTNTAMAPAMNKAGADRFYGSSVCRV